MTFLRCCFQARHEMAQELAADETKAEESAREGAQFKLMSLADDVSRPTTSIH